MYQFIFYEREIRYTKESLKLNVDFSIKLDVYSLSPIALGRVLTEMNFIFRKILGQPKAKNSF